MIRKIGYIAADVGERSALEITRLLQESGYDAVDWTTEQFDPLAESPQKLVELVSLAGDHGLGVGQFMAHQDLVTTNPEFWEERVQRTERALEASAEAGIGSVGVVTGPNPWVDNYELIGRDLEESEGWSLVFRALERILRRAEEIGSVKVSLEPCWGTLANDRYRAEYVFSRFESEYLGINFDPSHYVMSGDDIPDLIHAWGERIAHVHLKDAFGTPGLPERDFIFLLPGEGVVPFPEMFAALDDVGYDGVMSVEFEAFRLLNGPLRGDLGAGMKLAREFVRGLTRSDTVR
jgi:sugar phosphate isomerase/epimerase